MTQQVNVHGHEPGIQRVYQEGDMEYYLYRPLGNAPEGGWPILIYLHGIGQAMHNYSDKDGWVKQEIDDIKKHGSPASLCEADPPIVPNLASSFLVISPQFPFDPTPEQREKNRQGREWDWAEKATTIDNILDDVIKNFNGDPKRIFATGFSKGGRGAVALAKVLKNYQIAKLVLVDSVRGTFDSQIPDLPIWLHYGGNSTYEEIKAAHESQITQPGWINAPEDAPTPPGLHLFTDWNQNHTETCRRAYSDPRVYEWLLPQEQPQANS